MGYKNKQLHDYDQCDYCDMILQFIQKEINRKDTMKNALKDEPNFQYFSLYLDNVCIFEFQFLEHFNKIGISSKTIRLHLKVLVKTNKLFLYEESSSFPYFSPFPLMIKKIKTSTS
jgi:hypothetical protein